MPHYESFFRAKVLGEEQRSLPANHYNAMRLLLDYSGRPCVFVPIRTMQYMAVIDHEEVIFVDSQRKTDIEFAWRHFRPQTRESLQDPVPYHLEYYQPRAQQSLLRVQGEFFQAVQTLSKRLRRQEKSSPNAQKVISLHDRQA